MATVEQIARVLAWRKHLATKRSARNARKSSFDAGWDAALAWQVELAALDGATSTEWGVQMGGGVHKYDEKGARAISRVGGALVSRQVTEWRAAE